MPADLKYLREHYASLSDDALLAIHREDLVETAQRCYDDEIKQRGLASGRRAKLKEELPVEEDEVVEAEADPDQPDWLEDASEVYSRVVRTGNVQATDDLADARDVLEAAGIPCYLQLTERPEEQIVSPPTNLWRLLVPGILNLRATSVLDRDIFNHEFEETWRVHLETLSDAELRQMNPQVVFCGLFDRVERVTKVYEDELTRRKLISGR
jgi:hypothetical protein